MRSIACILAVLCALQVCAFAQAPVTLTPQKIGDGVWFIEMPTEPEFIGSNVGIVELDDGVLVIDAGFPLAARLVQDAVRTLTDKPVRFVLDTHFHPDHAFGNAVFADAGATILATNACIAEARGSNPAAFAAQASNARTARMVEGSRWLDPAIGFDGTLVLGNATRRVELIAIGHAHTRGDAVVWLPEQRILFTGDACVNGPHNFMGHASSEPWIEALDHMARLEPTTVAPGHGALGDAAMIAHQRRWFLELREHVARGLAQRHDLATITRELDLPWYRDWAGVDASSRTSNVQHVFMELTGQLMPRALRELELEPGTVRPKDDAAWVAPSKIVLTGFAARMLDELAHVAPGVELVAPQGDDALKAALADADAVVGSVSKVILDAAPKLRWAQVTSAGVDRFVGIEGLTERRVTLTNAQRLYGPQIAEHVLALLLALVRGIDDAARLTRAGTWDDDAVGAGVGLGAVRGKTVLVVGLGGIGLEVAKRCKALGMTVLATKSTKDRRYEVVDELGTPDRLNTLAARADFVVNCLPLTPATTGLFDDAFFTAAKRGHVFINIGRGKSVDTTALVAALNDGRVRAAGLDVTEPEPLPAGHPLWSAKNVLITPHMSAGGPDQPELLRLLVRENVRRFCAGEALLNVVDVARGY
ncbi:MAG: MBL fold metallo-hydrolase [Planctomycetes bacterium]|nr:MBL fold metallo-hydrolase [Planctomycetota bacterium]